jgi:hypothetical protein
MNNYAGRNAQDPPKGGGGFVVNNGHCSEECNFVPCEDGYVYGHFETIKGDQDRQIILERIGANRKDEFLDGVDIVWTAPIEGFDPRTVVGWSRNARLYRRRQHFNNNFPSSQHLKDEISSFMVRANVEDVVLLHPAKRTMKLSRGDGWSGQTSWWYAEQTKNPEAKRFVNAVKAMINKNSSVTASIAKNGTSKKKGRAGAAAEAYQRYVGEYEVKVSPRHHKLQEKFEVFLRKSYSQISFPKCFRDDLRYAVNGEKEVMVEIKPTDQTTIRFAIRTAIGQLLDYRQHQQWKGRQLVLVETEVTNVEDMMLALDNGFGLAWPVGTKEFKIHWP